MERITKDNIKSIGYLKPIKGYEGMYEISKNGKVLSFKRNPAILSQYKSDYYKVGLTKDGVQKFFAVHRLLAIAFIPNPENKPCINHIDGDKYNNSLDNLEWVTHSENTIHAFKFGLSKVTDETKAKMSKAKKGLIPWNKGKRLKPPTHGTMTEYNYGCRCDKCKKCNTDYCRTKRERKKLNTNQP